MSAEIGDHKGERSTRRIARSPWLAAAIGGLCSILAWWLVNDFESRLGAARFAIEAEERLNSLRHQLDHASDALADVSMFYAEIGPRSRERFNKLAAPVLARYPAVRALSWNPVVPLHERSAHEAAVRAQGIADYQITERGPAGELRPATRRERYVVPVVIEPARGNESALGFDLASEEIRRAAVERATLTGEMTVAAPISLVQASDAPTGALALLARYSGDVSNATDEQRRARLDGFFVAVVQFSGLIDAAVDGLGSESIAISLASAESSAHGAPHAHAAAEHRHRFSADAEPLRMTEALSWGGHELVAVFSATDAFASEGRTWLPYRTLATGLLLTSLLVLYLRTLTSRTAYIEREVAERTQALRRANLELETEVAQRTAAERQLEAYRDDLEHRVHERTLELESATNQLRAILDTEPECVKILDASGTLLDINPAGLRLIEADSLEEVRGLSVYPLIADEYRDAFIELNRRVIAGESQTLEYQIQGLRGGKYWVETHAVPLATANADRNLYLAVTRDVTARRRAEEEREELERQLRHAQKLEGIGVLAGGIAHDFNNLLQVIVSNNEAALGDAAAGSLAKEAVEQSNAAAGEAARLCHQMLAYAGQSHPDKQSLSLASLSREIVTLLGASHSKKAKLELAIDDEVRPVEGDPGQLHQVVMNLVTNASDAIGDTAGQISVLVRDIEIKQERVSGDWFDQPPPPGAYVALVVSDTGCGMDHATLDRIFDPFFTTKFAGRGLGLASTLGIVRSHSGFLSVTSEPGQGSHFTVLLPATSASATVVPATLHPSDETFEATALVVDDEKSVRDATRRQLEHLGFEVVVAENGREAVRIFEARSDEIDVVVLDLTMPELGGRECCDLLRATRSDLPVLFCSGYDDDAAQMRPRERDITRFLHKPYRQAEMVAQLHAILGSAPA